MNFLIEIFNSLLYRPLFNALIFLYQFLPGNDFGIAVIALTILIRIILSPFMTRSLKSQGMMAEVQEELKEIQRIYKENPEKQMKQITTLYKEKQINPFDGIIFMLIQLPLLIALYRVFWRGINLEELNYLYSFIPRPEVINFKFLNLIDLSRPSLVLSVLAGGVQFIQSKTMSKPKSNPKTKEPQERTAEMISKQMLFFFPILTIIILLRLPAAVGLYWVITSLFSVVQQGLLNRNQAKI